MPKPNEKFTVKQMKDFIRSHKNVKIKLTQTRANLIADLKKHGQWEGSTPSKKTTPKKAKTSTNKEWEKLKKMPLFKEYMRKYMKNYDDTYQEKLDYVENNIFNKGLSTVKKFMEYIPEAI
jgi:carbamoylphosphate synthase small subunit